MTAGEAGGGARRRRKGKWFKRFAPPIAGAVLGAVAGAVVTSIVNPADRHTAVAAAEPKPSGKITSLDGSAVGTKVLLKGSIRSMPKGYALWAFVEDGSGHFFPAYSPCVIEDNQNDFHCPELRPAAAGAQSGTHRSVQVALVNALGANAISHYRQDRETTGKSKPLANMTDGAIEIDARDVVTQ